jgi:aminoglycoside phosphotransferase (APT) family kinase protein
LPVPEVIRVGDGWIVHRRVPGEPLGAPTGAHGRQLGDFLAVLHALPVEPFRTAGVHQHDPARHTGCFRGQVLPLVDDHERHPAELLLAEYEEVSLDLRAAHRDLGPEHVLHDGERITGVIDWSDFALAEPAIDLAWPLFGTTAEFVSALSAAYGGVDAQVRRRALVYHAIGPWHEVVYGLATGERRWIESGLLGVRARLRKATGNADTMAK